MYCEVVTPGSNGYLAATAVEWENHLRTLLTKDDRGRSLGRAGRQLVEQRFDRRLVAPHTAELIAAAARAHSPE
jgi:glycosyltransferase involved in cell wall biosynthesis